MTKKLLLLSLVVALGLTIAGCGQKEASQQETTTTSPEPTSELAPEPATVAKTMPAPSVRDVQEENNAGYLKPEETPPTTEAVSGENIKITAPLAESTVTSPVLISGEARSVDNKIYLRIRRSDDIIVVPEQAINVKASTPGEWGSFSINITYVFNETKVGTIELYAKENEAEKILAQVPVKFE